MVRSAWTAAGGRWEGRARFERGAARGANWLEWTSPRTLADVVGDILKFSNNVMSRQLMLQLATPPRPRGAGVTLEQGAQAAVVESVKAASEVYAPVAGEVVAVNAELEGAPALVNEDAAGKGWFLKLRVSDATQLDALMDEAAYAAFVKSCC